MPPVNDAFANATLLTGTSGTLVDETNAAATTDGANDPLDQLFHNFGNATVWYKFVASESGNLNVATAAGTGTAIGDSVVGIYSGAALGSLTELGFDDDAGAGAYSNVTVRLHSAATYYIEVTGYGNANAGTFNLSWAFTAATGATGLLMMQGVDGYAVNSGLFIVDPITAALTWLKSSTGYSICGMATHPTSGVCYGSTAYDSPTNPNSLVTIDLATGTVTYVATFSVTTASVSSIYDMAFDSSGVLYGWAKAGVSGSPNPSYLCTINLSTATMTRVGSWDFPWNISCFPYGMEFSGGTLYAVLIGVQQWLYTINTTTGEATQLYALVDVDNGDTNWYCLSMAEFGGTMYGIHSQFRNSRLISFALTSGNYYHHPSDDLTWMTDAAALVGGVAPTFVPQIYRRL